MYGRKCLFFRFCCKTDGFLTAIKPRTSNPSVRQRETGTLFTDGKREIGNASVKEDGEQYKSPDEPVVMVISGFR